MAIDDDDVPTPGQKIGPLLTSMAFANKHVFAGGGAIAEDAGKTRRTTTIAISNKANAVWTVKIISLLPVGVQLTRKRKDRQSSVTGWR